MNYGIIANCNYESSDDLHYVHEARLAVESGQMDDQNLCEALDDLEKALTEELDDNGEYRHGVTSQEIIDDAEGVVHATFVAATELTEIETEFDNTVDQWTGCDWTTDHGTTGLDLDGVSVDMAKERAADEELSDEEREDWVSAAEWLQEVMEAAEGAHDMAESAVEYAKVGDWHRAEHDIDEACSIEEVYGDCPTYRRLRVLIKNATGH